MDLFADSREFEKFQNEINEIYCTATVSLQKNDERTILGYYGFLHDVTEQKTTLDTLRRGEANIVKWLRN